MNELHRWLTRQSRRERSAVILEDALLSNRFGAYALYRLRYFFLRFGADLFIHAVRVLLLYRIFSSAEFIMVLVAYAVVGLASSFWWGFLEPMRGRVRDLYRSGLQRDIPAEIARWLALSLHLAGVALVAAALWVALHLIASSFGPAELYVTVTIVGGGLNLATRCYHSGVYAVRRIYRPMSAVLGLEAAGLLLVLGLWPLGGPWALPASAALSTLLAVFFTMRFTARSYSFLAFSPSKHISIHAVRIPEGMREGFAAGASYAVMHLDSLLVLALFSVGSRSHETALFALFFAAGPSVRAGFDWSQLFYFDLKRLDVKLFANLKRRFENAMLRLAWLLGGLFWAAGVLVVIVLFGDPGRSFYWLALPFFVLRSLLGAVQVQAFSERAYGKVIGAGTWFPLAFLLMAAWSRPEAEQLALLSLATAAAVVMVAAWRRISKPEQESTGLLWVSEWLGRLSQVTHPVVVHSAEVYSPWQRTGDGREAEENSWRLYRMAEKLARKLGQAGNVAVIDGKRLAWYTVGHAGPAVNADWVMRMSGGLLMPATSTGVRESGAEALRTARWLGLLTRVKPEGFSTDQALEKLKREFLRSFPQGIIYDPARALPRELDSLSSREKRLILRDALVFSRDFDTAFRRSRFDVTSACIGGELKVIFVARGRGTGRAARWRERVKDFTLRAAVGMRPPPAKAAKTSVPGWKNDRRVWALLRRGLAMMILPLTGQTRFFY